MPRKGILDRATDTLRDVGEGLGLVRRKPRTRQRTKLGNTARRIRMTVKRKTTRMRSRRRK